MDTPSQLLEMCEAGLLTPRELINKLVDLAADLDPASYIPDLPQHLIAAVRERVQNLPTTVDDVFLLGSVTYKPGVDVTAAVDRERERAFASAHRLHDYFS